MSVAFKRLILSSLGSMTVPLLLILNELKRSCSKKDQMLNVISIMTKNTILRNFHNNNKKDANSAMSQSEIEANTCNRGQARENACERGTIGFGSASYYLRKWREF